MHENTEHFAFRFTQRGTGNGELETLFLEQMPVEAQAAPC